MKLKALATLGTAILLLTGCSLGNTESTDVEAPTSPGNISTDKVTIEHVPPLYGSEANYVPNEVATTSNKEVTFYKLTPNPDTGKFGYLDMSGDKYNLTAELIEVDMDGNVLPGAKPIFKTFTVFDAINGYSITYGEAPALPESGILSADVSSGQVHYTWTGSVYDFEHVFSGQPESSSN